MSPPFSLHVVDVHFADAAAVAMDCPSPVKSHERTAVDDHGASTTAVLAVRRQVSLRQFLHYRTYLQDHQQNMVPMVADQ